MADIRAGIAAAGGVDLDLLNFARQLAAQLEGGRAHLRALGWSEAEANRALALVILRARDGSQTTVGDTLDRFLDHVARDPEGARRGITARS